MSSGNLERWAVWRRWWLVIIGLAGLTIVIVCLLVIVMNPSTAVLEEDGLKGVTIHQVKIDGKYVVMDMGTDRDANISKIRYRLFESKTNRTVMEGTLRPYHYPAEVSWSSPIFYRLNGRGNYSLALEPSPENHEGTYSVAMNRTDISQDTRVKLVIVPITVSVPILVMGYLNYRRRMRNGEKFDKIQIIEMGLVSGTLFLAVLTGYVA